MISIFMSLLYFIPLKAQHQDVRNLCFDEEVTTVISVVSDLELSTLTISDKLKFKKKHYVKNHHKYFGENGDAIHDIHFISQENMFPKWYNHPSTIRSDRTGTKSFFANRSDHITDGWVGGLISKTKHGEYIEDARTGERFLSQLYSKKADQTYQSWNAMMDSHGFLMKYSFAYPTNSVLQEMQNNGYTVTKENNMIIARNLSINMVWDLNNKIFVRQLVENASVKKSIKTYYQYDAQFDSYLISKIVKTTPKIFNNGDCYDLIVQTCYTNYSDGCSQQNVSMRSNDEGELLLNLPQLKLYPNPVTDKLKIDLPEFDLESQMQLMSIEGDILMFRRIEANKSSFVIDVSDLPSGIYIVKNQQGKNNYSSKFVKR